MSTELELGGLEAVFLLNLWIVVVLALMLGLKLVEWLSRGKRGRG